MYKTSDEANMRFLLYGFIYMPSKLLMVFWAIVFVRNMFNVGWDNYLEYYYDKYCIFNAYF